MTKQSRTNREYSFGDLGKTLLKGMKGAICCALAAAILFGGVLGCIARFVTHDEYTVKLVKTDTVYDVPVIPAAVRDNIYRALCKTSVGQKMTSDGLNGLSREMDRHLKITEPEGNNEVYEFTLTSFRSSVTELGEKDFADVMNLLMEDYRNAYAEKIVADYTVPSTAFSAAKSTNYYLQTETLRNYLDFIIEEIQTIVNNSLTTEVKESNPRSAFSAYLCPENGHRAGDSLLALNDVYYEIYYAQSFIGENGIEKEGTKPMSDYIQGQLLHNPTALPWTELKDRFNENSVYQRATQAEKEVLAAKTEQLLDGITARIQEILDDYNVTASGFAASVVDEYVVISSLTEEKSVGALDTASVVIITVAGVIISVIICYAFTFAKLKKDGVIGSEVSEDSDEE